MAGGRVQDIWAQLFRAQSTDAGMKDAKITAGADRRAFEMLQKLFAHTLAVISYARVLENTAAMIAAKKMRGSDTGKGKKHERIQFAKSKKRRDTRVDAKRVDCILARAARPLC